MKAFMAVIAALVAIIFITTVAHADAIQEAKDREVVVQYTGLVVTTLAAAEATDNKDFWEAATDAAAASDDPVGTLYRLMEATDWASDALAIYDMIYGSIGIEGAYSASQSIYANQNSI